MSDQGQYYDLLVEEFTNIKVFVEIGNDCFAEEDTKRIIPHEDGEDEIAYDYNYYFYLKFQNENKVHCFTYFSFTDEYLAKLNKLRLGFYKEINNRLVGCDNKFNIQNQLNQYHIIFSELLDNYYLDDFPLKNNKIILRQNKSIKVTFSDNKPIYDFDVARIIDKFLSVQVETIEKIINYLKEKLSLITSFPYSNLSSKLQSEITDRVKRTYPTLSFKITNEVYSHNKMRSFHNALERFKCIEKVPYQRFVRIFTNNEVHEPLIWLKDESVLYYFIKELRIRNIIKHFKNYWQVTARCFVLKKDNKIILLKSKKLARNKIPQDPLMKREFNAIFLTWIDPIRS